MKYCAGLLVAFMLTNISAAIAKDTVSVKLNSIYSIDACGKSKEVLITLEIGEIAKADSLFGFNFGLKFDSSKVKFTSLITQSTLSEFFDTKGSSVYSEDSLFAGYAANLNFALPPGSGNLPLVAVLGEWKTDCPDSTQIWIEYIDFTEEFKKHVLKGDALTITSKVKDKADRVLGLSFEKDSMKLIDKDSDECLLKINTIDKAKLTEFKIDLINGINNNINCTAENDNANGFEIVSTENIGDTLRLKVISVLDKNYGEIKLKFAKKLQDTANFAIKAFAYDVNNCACITRFEMDSILVLSNKKQDDTSSAVYEDKNARFVYDNSTKSIILESEYGIYNVSMYDVNGIETIKYYENLRKAAILNLADIPNGVYAVRAELGSGKIIKKILIKY